MEAKRASSLGLPREIRDQICFYLFDNGKNPPPSPSFSGKRTRTTSDIMLPIDHAVFRYPKLVFVNRQLYDEVRQNLQALYRTGTAPVELDIMARGYLLYPTWTSLPGFIRRGDPFDLNIELRIFSTEGFKMNDGWPRQPGTGFRSLLTLLNNLLLSGPPFELPKPQDMDRTPYFLETLFMNITFHDLYTPRTWLGTSVEIVRMLKCLAVSGIPSPYIKKIKVRAFFEVPSLEAGVRSISYNFEKEWQVAESCDQDMWEQWQRAGFRFLPRTIDSHRDEEREERPI